MSFWILACVLACASAAYTGPQHYPVINAQGVPVDTAEVQLAKASHFAAKGEAYAPEGQYYPHFYNAHYPQFYNTQYPHFYNYAPYVYAPYSYVNKEVPAETPEVVAAKISHFAAHAEALSRTGHRERRGIYAPVAYSAAYTAPFAHAPVVAHSPVFAHAPVVAHTPLVPHAYSAYPYVSSATYTLKY